MTKLNNTLTKLQIQNFKSLKNISISPGRVNVFIGKPNAGKTNLLEALTLLGLDFRSKPSISKDEVRYTDLASLFYGQSYDKEIRIITNRLSCCLTHAGKLFFLLISSERPGELNKLTNHIIENPEAFSLDLGEVHRLLFNIKGATTGLSNILPSNIKRYQFNTHSNVKSIFVNSISLLDIIRHNSYLKSFSNDFFKEFSLEVLYDVRHNKMNIMKKSEDSYYLIDFSMTPDTFQRMLYYLAVVEANKNSVILLEEPESQSYPPYIQMLAEKIVEDKHNQYFITTHSPFIVEKMLQKAGPDGDVKIFITYFEDYQTKVHELTPTEIDYIIDNSVDLFFNIESFQK
jgi:AAA15 family ATPase/GTPase